MKVLVTDDDADSRELVRLTLALHQIQVVEAGGGIECLKVAQETRPDAILLDVMMPSMDGPTTLTALRANPVTASIPVIFLTASAMPSEVERLKKLGARAVVAKPFDPFTLPNAVRELLAEGMRLEDRRNGLVGDRETVLASYRLTIPAFGARSASS